VKPASKVTQYSSGPMGYAVDITAPANTPAIGIMGQGKMMTSKGPKGPSFSKGPQGFHAPMDSPKCKEKRGGPSRAGGAMTQGGTSSPGFKTGPSGLGESGSNYGPVG